MNPRPMLLVIPVTAWGTTEAQVNVILLAPPYVPLIQPPY